MWPKTGDWLLAWILNLAPLVITITWKTQKLIIDHLVVAIVNNVYEIYVTLKIIVLCVVWQNRDRCLYYMLYVIYSVYYLMIIVWLCTTLDSFISLKFRGWMHRLWQLTSQALIDNIRPLCNIIKCNMHMYFVCCLAAVASCVQTWQQTTPSIILSSPSPSPPRDTGAQHSWPQPDSDSDSWDVSWQVTVRGQGPRSWWHEPHSSTDYVYR